MGIVSFTNGLIPQDVTRALALKESGNVDGRDVTIAVLDTGVDPAAPGLARTSDGRRKVLDLVDCTCSGDVVTTTTAALGESSSLVGLSGRTLKVPPHIVALNPTNVFRLGIKHAYEFFPQALTRRLRRERRTAWDRIHSPLVNDAGLQIAELKASQAPTLDEAEKRLAVLQAAEKHYRDTGPIFDCVVFHDGTNWRAVVDTSERGDLSQCDVLENFAINGAYSHFPGGVMLNFAVNIYEDGNLLSIVVDAGSHGTHVSGILAAHFPEEPHLDGVAPGANIVSLKIGDARLGSMETHQGLTRAIMYCLAHSGPAKADKPSPQVFNVIDGEDPDPQFDPTTSQGTLANATNRVRQHASGRTIYVDLINMSYGEHSRDVNHGRFVRLVDKLIHEHNVLFVSSAGNEGPGLSSVSAPGGTTSSMIGVGAYVTPDMLTQAYSYFHAEFGSTSPQLVESSTKNEEDDFAPVHGISYTWSSRGPVPDGSMGVCICAPGGAIAPVPVWNLKKKDLMHGTSMSSPSAAGSIAVLLSYLKSKRIPYTSALVRRAIENSARPFKPFFSHCPDSSPTSIRINQTELTDSVFATGHGSIDVLAASRYVERYMARRQRKAPSAPNTIQPEEGNSAKETDTPITNHNKAKPVEKPTLCSVDARPASFYSKFEECGNSTFHLEDWPFKITVEEGSGRRRPSGVGVGFLHAQRGIYLRGLTDTSSLCRATVMAELMGRDEDKIHTKATVANMEVHLKLQCSAPWVEVPPVAVFLGGSTSFPIVVDPTRLAAGHPHFTQVLAFVRAQDNQEDCAHGPVFRVPISVHKPEPVISGTKVRPLENIPFAPGFVLRRFYQAPHGATCAVIRIKAGLNFASGSDGASTSFEANSLHGGASEQEPLHDDVALVPSVSEPSVELVSMATGSQLGLSQEQGGQVLPALADGVAPTYTDKILEDSESKASGKSSGNERNFEVHVLQLLPRRHPGESESRQTFTLQPGFAREYDIRVNGGSTIELCLAQTWSSPGKCIVEKIELTFGGLIPNPTALYIEAGCLSSPRVDVGNSLPPEPPGLHSTQPIAEFSPKGALSHLQKVALPKGSRISQLSSRDLLPDSVKMFQLQLEYSFESYDASCPIRIKFPDFNRSVYEAELEGGPYILVHDAHKQFMFTSDIYPSESKLPKGEYTASAYIRHDRLEILERLRELRATVEYELSSEISLDAYDTRQAASLAISRRACRGSSMPPLKSGERRAFYFAAPKRSAIPSWAKNGDVLTGRMNVERMLHPSSGRGRRSGNVPNYSLSLYVGSSSSSKSDSKRAEGKSDKAVVAKTETVEFKDAKKTEPVMRVLDTPRQTSASLDPVSNAAEVEEGSDDVNKWLDEAVKKLKLDRLRSLMKDSKKSADFISLSHKYEEEADCSQDVDFLMMKLEFADVTLSRKYKSGEADTDTLSALAMELVKQSLSVVKILDPQAIAAHFGCNIDAENTAEVASRKKFERKRAQLVDAYFRRARAWSQLHGWMRAANEPKASGDAAKPSGTGVAMSAADGDAAGVGSRTAAARDGSETAEPTKTTIQSSVNRGGRRPAEGAGTDGIAPASTLRTTGSVEKGAQPLRQGVVEETRVAFETAVGDLMKWVTVDGKGSLPDGCGPGHGEAEVTNEGLAVLGARREQWRGRLCAALRVLDNYFGDGGSKRVDPRHVVEMREAFYTELSWTHLAESERNYRLKRFPIQEAHY